MTWCQYDSCRLAWRGRWRIAEATKELGSLGEERCGRQGTSAALLSLSHQAWTVSQASTLGPSSVTWLRRTPSTTCPFFFSLRFPSSQRWNPLACAPASSSFSSLTTHTGALPILRTHHAGPHLAICWLVNIKVHICALSTGTIKFTHHLRRHFQKQSRSF